VTSQSASRPSASRTRVTFDSTALAELVDASVVIYNPDLDSGRQAADQIVEFVYRLMAG
jgi:hypothetical protein